jgi:hypothetical protein
LCRQVKIGKNNRTRSCCDCNFEGGTTVDWNHLVLGRPQNQWVKKLDMAPVALELVPTSALSTTEAT